MSVIYLFTIKFIFIISDSQKYTPKYKTPHSSENIITFKEISRACVGAFVICDMYFYSNFSCLNVESDCKMFQLNNSYTDVLIYK